jgi:two-component system sensor histidine kinase and response regulator WspE
MEDCFVAAQKGKIKLRQEEIDVLFRGVDLLLYISKRSEAELAAWETDHATEINDFLESLTRVMTAGQVIEFSTAAPLLDALAGETALSPSEPSTPPALSGVAMKPPVSELVTTPSEKREVSDRVLRLTAENLNRLLGLAGESLVGSRWLNPFADSMLRLKRQQSDLAKSLDSLRESLTEHHLSERTSEQLNDVFGRVSECREALTDRLADLEIYDRRSANLSHRLYLEVLKCRMRPFGDAVGRYPRMIRDLARSLGKEVQLEIIGDTTQVDRDILEKLEAPLAHLLRNLWKHAGRRESHPRAPCDWRPATALVCC